MCGEKYVKTVFVQLEEVSNVYAINGFHTVLCLELGNWSLGWKGSRKAAFELVVFSPKLAFGTADCV